MNPFAERSSKHSTWPVILTIYNLPPWLMQKRKYILLTILISGPTQPGVDMDVFLEPLMEDMKILWEIGVQMLDEYCWGLVLKCYESRTRQHKMLDINALRPLKHYLPKDLMSFGRRP
jgi:hypothetical protein